MGVRNKCLSYIFCVGDPAHVDADPAHVDADPQIWNDKDLDPVL